VPLAKYYTPFEVVHDAHERERRLFNRVEVEGAGMLDMLVAPFQFGGEPLTLSGGPPQLGDYARAMAEATQ
jgi:crotonobetainyl-CoA:carnitine CoA-transferase CaiB-like acyl-CoA transferase